MTTRSLEVEYVISDKATAERFIKGYEAAAGRAETLPDVHKLLEEGRKCLEAGLFDE
jgi:hypothetical protein